MRLALMIIGLALAAVMGFQSFSLMTHPFANDAISAAGGYGVLAAFVAVVGAAFSLQYPVAAVLGYGLAALIAVATGLNSPFEDLSIWGAGLGILAALALVAQLKTSKPGGSGNQQLEFTAATGDRTSSATFASAIDSPPNAEGDLFGQLERLGRLRASGALSDTEFATMKTELIARHESTSGAST